MQPPAPQKPVMDVTAPSPAQPRPADNPAPVAVHAAPASEEVRTESAATEAPKTDSPTHEPVAPNPEKNRPKPTKAPAQPVAKKSAAPASQAPVGAIVGAIAGMLVLSGIAVAIYLNS